MLAWLSGGTSNLSCCKNVVTGDPAPCNQQGLVLFGASPGGIEADHGEQHAARQHQHQHLAVHAGPAVRSGTSRGGAGGVTRAAASPSPAPAPCPPRPAAYCSHTRQAVACPQGRCSPAFSPRVARRCTPEAWSIAGAAHTCEARGQAPPRSTPPPPGGGGGGRPGWC